MKKIFLLLLVLSLGIVGCTASVIDPYTVALNEDKQIAVEILRADVGGVKIKVLNKTDKEIEIDWENTYLNDEKVTFVKDMKFANEVGKTKLSAKGSLEETLYRKVDVYYLNPVEYSHGGFKVKDLKYPALLKLSVDGKAQKIFIYDTNREVYEKSMPKQK